MAFAAICVSRHSTRLSLGGVGEDASLSLGIDSNRATTAALGVVSDCTFCQLGKGVRLEVCCLACVREMLSETRRDQTLFAVAKSRFDVGRTSKDHPLIVAANTPCRTCWYQTQHNPYGPIKLSVST
jgi:hypothetical protein